MKKLFWPSYSLDGDTKKLNLTRIQKFLEKMGNPEDKLPPVFHVAGTNGKGSTTAFLKYILEAEGYLTHRFTSPHLVDLNERIEVSSKIISDEYLNELAEECKQFAEKNNLAISYFEGLFIISILAYIRNPAVATILEVGLGGRLDATNIIKTPLVEIITSISFDHMKILGNTLRAIAIEKSGIIKECGTLIIDKQPQEAFDAIYEVGKERNNKIYSYGKEWSVEKLKNSFIFKGFNKEMELPLPYLEGEHQIYNAGGAIAAILSQNKIKVSDKSIAEGMKNVRWIGRLQNMSSNKKINENLATGTEVIIDGAHNEGGAGEISKWINSKEAKKYNILIIGILERKDSRDYIQKLNKSFDLVITINITNEEKSKNSNVLKEDFIACGWNNIIASENFKTALKYVGENFKDGQNTRILIAGSLYLMGEILDYAR